MRNRIQIENEIKEGGKNERNEGSNESYLSYLQQGSNGQL
jgi:hypothetical protein